MQVRTVHGGGQIAFRGRDWFVTQALRGEPVAVRPTATDGVFSVVYCHHHLATLDLHTHDPAHPSVADAAGGGSAGVKHVPDAVDVFAGLYRGSLCPPAFRSQACFIERVCICAPREGRAPSPKIHRSHSFKEPRLETKTDGPELARPFS